jgi:NAD/NADP transhydrogenase beta subunit
MDGRTFGLMLVAVGLGVAILGLLVFTGAFSWFGRLPGDLRFGGERAQVFIPITSMVLISLVLTLILSVLRR